MNNLPLIDDWVGSTPDAWDFEKILTDNNVTCNYDGSGWHFLWRHGTIFIGRHGVETARKAVALFVSLYLRRFSASFSAKITQGYVLFLERERLACTQVIKQL